MAKESFQRVKPHVNVIVYNRLGEFGASPAGVFQVLQGLPVVNPDDRRSILDFICEPRASTGQATGKRVHAGLRMRHYYDHGTRTSGVPTGKRQSKFCAVTQPPGFLSQAMESDVLYSKFTKAGIQQLAGGMFLSDPDDRKLLAELLLILA